jgi:hypothetical protein
VGGKPTDEVQNSQNKVTSESNDEKYSSENEVSKFCAEHDRTQQPTLPQADANPRIDSMPPRYEEIEHNTVKSQLEGDKVAGIDDRTIGSPISQQRPLQNRAKLRRKRIETVSKLKDKRNRVVDLRLRLHELRTSLRQQRDSLSVRDAQLIQGMRFVFLGNELTGRGPLHEEFERLQEARDSLQPLQDDYDRLEDEVNREEHDLGELESRLYPLDVSAQNSALDGEELAILDGRIEYAESSLSAHSGPADTSSKVNRYLSRKGDVHLLRERLDELRMERAQIVEEEYVRAQIGRVLDDYSRDFLLNFDSRHDELQRELAEAEEDVARLKIALTDNEDFINSPDQFDGTQPEISDEDTPATTRRNSFNQTSEVLNSADSTLDAQEPLLLSGAEVPSPVFSGRATEGSKNVVSKATYINQWLLHRLRRSLHEVRRFKATLELQNLNLDQTQIKEMALELWFHDSSAETFAMNRKKAAESLNFSVQTTQGLPVRRETKSETNAAGLQEAILQARNNQKRPALRHSGDSSPVQPFTPLFHRVSPSTFHF